jgi:haloalkane dehalogenase
VPKGTRGVGDHYWFKWVNSEEFAPVITHLGSTVLSVMKRIGFENTAHIDETWVRAYAAPFPTVDSCRGALQFPRNIASRETFDFYEELSANHDLEAFKAIPAMYVHGEEDRAIPTEWAVTAFRTFWPNAPLTTLPGVGHFLQEDAPQTVCALVEQFVQTCG